MCLSIRAIFIDFMIALSRQPVWEADYAGCSSEDAASVPGNQETGDRSSGVQELQNGRPNRAFPETSDDALPALETILRYS
jgi:hypothetical protein